MAKGLDAARQRGALAFAMGAPATANPYRSRVGYGPAWRRAWGEGYDRARRAKQISRAAAPVAKDAPACVHDFVMAALDPGVDICTRCAVLRF